MTTTWNRVSGDVNDTITPIILEKHRTTGIETPVDLSTVTAVTVDVWAEWQAKVTLTAAVLSALDGTLLVQLGRSIDVTPWLATAVPGKWFVEYHLTFAGGGAPITWPSDSPDIIHVRARHPS